ncbi:MAG: chromosome segregation protein SMC [Oscillospiraceae bacterium]
MLLKYLEIQGFKSFPDKTKVAFGKGLTAVVGPNGSGKSNISDAVRWVMGEQSTKTLRGNKMEDVIFTGTKTRKSQGFAEVSLTVDNSNRELPIDNDEITITRRYDRSGESEYMINRSVVRLKDLQEILMDTGLGKDGYSMVGQGKIAEIVQSKSNERREIFEEAAGISKFRYKKNESERSLERAEENLVRLRDILLELESRVGPLKEQSEKAKRFIELVDRKKSLEVSLWIDTIEYSNQALKDQGDKILISAGQREEIESQIQEIENEIQQAFLDMQNSLILIDTMRHEKDEIEGTISELTSQVAVCENDIEHNKQSIIRIQTEINNNAKDFDTVNLDIQDKNNQINTINIKLFEVNELIANKQESLLAMSTQTDHLSIQEKQLSVSLNNLLLEQSQAKMAISLAESNLTELIEVIHKNEADLLEKQKEIDAYQNELHDATAFMEELNEKAESLSNTYSGHKMKLENRTQKLNAIKIECDKVGLEIKEKEQKVKLLEGMEQSLDGFAFSVKEVIKKYKKGTLKGIYGTVSQLIEVKNEYSTAIETALGGAMQNIVVATEADAKAAIRALKEDNLGRATFLPLTTITGSMLNVAGLDRYSGFIDVAANLVSYDKQYEGIVSSLLSRIVIVDDIDTAVLIAQKNNYKFKIVTLDGQVINPGGSLTGGSKNKGQSFLSRKNDIASIQSEIETLTLKLSQNKSTMNVLHEDVLKIEAQFTALTSEITTLNEDKIRVAGECKRVEQMVLHSTQAVANMSTELNVRRSKNKLTLQTKEQANDKLSMLEEDILKLSGELSDLQTNNQSATSIKTSLVDEISALNISSIGLSKDMEALSQSILELEHRKESTDVLSISLQEQITSFENNNKMILLNIEKITEDIKQKRETILALGQKIESTAAARQEFEGKTTILRKEERAITEQKEKLSSEMVRLEEKKNQIQREFDEIIAKLWDEYELTRSEAQSIAESLENPQKATADLNSIRLKIRALGSVNVAAIEEYQEVSGRYEFLNSQVRDAEKSRNELLKLINDLTQKMQDIFAENFEKINYYFKKIFVDLFGGGRADLKLSDPDNLLESGIEIFVEPPGKIIKNLASLSGGEQAFVAIAIYFAILKVRPAPFCIMDEIEAALDDVNVDKYATYLRSMCDKTQFIMITHRRGSMEAADVLYGVTMQDEGVSKLLELNVAEIENKLSLKL